MRFEKLRQARIDKGWSQELLSQKAGVSERTVINVERGKPCNFGTAKLLARALGLKLSDITEG